MGRDNEEMDDDVRGEVDVVRRRVLVSGRVQGVYYRDSCRSVARRLGVGGWVRNLVDGTVEVVAEGGRTSVEELVEWCRHGPPHAVVRRVEVSEEPPVGEPDFRVR